MNTNEYLERIQYQGETLINPDISTLKKLCESHSKTVPFDNFDMFGGEKRSLLLEKIYDKIVVKKRGGLCYESNGLFCWLLKELGFKVDILQAKVDIPGKDTVYKSLDHMCLMTTFNDGSKWLTDICFGIYTFLPLKLDDKEEQKQSSGVYRLRMEEDIKESVYVLERASKIIKGGRKKLREKAEKDWKPFYRFKLNPKELEDFNQANDYQHDHELSFLKHNAIGCIQTNEGITLTWGKNLCKKKYVDPYHEEVTSIVEAKSENDFKELLKKELDITIDFQLSTKSKDFVGFTDDKNDCEKDIAA